MKADPNYALGDWAIGEKTREPVLPPNSFQIRLQQAKEDAAGVYSLGDVYEAYRDPEDEHHALRVRRKDGQPIPEALEGRWTNVQAVRRKLKAL